MGGFGGVFARAVGDGANGDNDGGNRHQRGDQNMRRGGQAKTGHRHTDAGAHEGAEAVKTVHHRQHGFIHFPFNGGAFDVNRHFRRAEAGAKDSQPKGEQRRGGEPQRQA